MGTIEMAFLPEENACYLFNLATDAKIRNQGIGAKLLNCMEAIAHLLNIKDLYLQVLADNFKALRLYSKLGYQPCFVQPTTNNFVILLHKSI
jgi:ribosomal protein S18 acetylase RimI-like enzyme